MQNRQPLLQSLSCTECRTSHGNQLQSFTGKRLDTSFCRIEVRYGKLLGLSAPWLHKDEEEALPELATGKTGDGEIRKIAPQH